MRLLGWAIVLVGAAAILATEGRILVFFAGVVLVLLGAEVLVESRRQP